MKKVLSRMQNDGLTSSSSKCKKNENYRGLENRTEQGQKECNQQIHSCIDAVMDEQDKQWEEDIIDWERIADCSRQVSIYCSIVASKRAIQDAKDARKAYQSMTRKEMKTKTIDIEASSSSPGMLSTEDDEEDMLDDLPRPPAAGASPTATTADLLWKKLRSKKTRKGKKR